MSVQTHEIGGEGPAAKAERIALEKAAADEQVKADAVAKAEADAAPKAKKTFG